MGKFEPAPVIEISEDLEPPFLEAAAEWCRGKNWIIRAPLVLYLALAFIRHLRDPLYGSLLFGGITLGVHELGHVIFGFLGQFISILMGSGTQVLVPLVVIFIFFRQEDYFGMAVGGAWLSFSLFNLATYIGDARLMELPLVGLGPDPMHDWHYLLTRLGLIDHDRGLAFLTRAAAFTVGAASLAFAGWLLWKMYALRPARRRVIV
jgi:hypothetical protein